MCMYNIHSIITLRDTGSVSGIGTGADWVITRRLTCRAGGQWDLQQCSVPGDGQPRLPPVPPRLLPSFPRKLSGLFAPANFWAAVACRDAPAAPWPPSPLCFPQRVLQSGHGGALVLVIRGGLGPAGPRALAGAQLALPQLLLRLLVEMCRGAKRAAVQRVSAAPPASCSGCMQAGLRLARVRRRRRRARKPSSGAAVEADTVCARWAPAPLLFLWKKDG